MKEQFGVYKVVGNRAYRGHTPGTVFEAALEPGPEQRAIDRGDITLIERVTPDLEPGSYRLPRGWPPPGTAAPSATTGAPKGASSIGGGRW